MDPIDVLNYSDETGKRAVYEAFAFELPGAGDVVVRNESHEEPAEHEYTVHVVNGIPSDCECPADEYHEGACKHRVAVALRPAIAEAAEAGQETPVLADGGLPEYLTEMSRLTGGTVYRCQTCGGEGDGVEAVEHHEECPELGGSA